jgi:hypothetical protein
MSRKTAGFVATGLVLGLSCLAWADAAGDYEALFGQEEKAAIAKGAAASAEFAARLLSAAKSAGGQKDLQDLLCDKAYEFGMKATAGFQTAADAMNFLIETMPDKRIAAREKLLKVVQLCYAKSVKKDEREKLGLELVDLLAACGDDKAEARQLAEAVALYRQALTLATMWKSGRTTEIMDKIKQLSAAQEAERRIVVLKVRLERNPKDAAARTALVMAYLGELDDPNEAAKLLTPDVDEGLRTYVPLAAEKVEGLKEAACIQLAEWLAAVAEKSSPADKPVLLGRARACCERYLEVHTAEDAALLKGRMLLEKIAKTINPLLMPASRFRKGLVLYLPLDEKSDKAADKSDKGNHGVVYEARYTTKGRVGGAYVLDGSNDHIEIANSDSLEVRKELTVAIWVKLASLGPKGYGNEQGYIVNKGDGLWWNPAFCLGFEKGAGRVLFHVCNETGSQNGGGKTVMGTTKLEPDMWYHLAGTYDGAEVKIYVNGRLEAAEKYSGLLRADRAPIHLGGGKLFGTGWGNQFTITGTIDELMIWDRALTKDEVSGIRGR